MVFFILGQFYFIIKNTNISEFKEQLKSLMKLYGNMETHSHTDGSGNTSLQVFNLEIHKGNV